MELAGRGEKGSGGCRPAQERIKHICPGERRERCRSGFSEGNGKKLKALSAIFLYGCCRAGRDSDEEGGDGVLDFCLCGQGEKAGSFLSLRSHLRL